MMAVFAREAMRVTDTMTIPYDDEDDEGESGEACHAMRYVCSRDETDGG